MRLLAVMSVAFAALARNKMRSLLTTLGVMIGVAAVIVMQGMGEGATAYVGQTISGLGSNMLIVMPGIRHGRFGTMTLGVPLFTNQDIASVREGAHDVALLASTNVRNLRVVSPFGNRTPSVGGVSPDYFRIRDWGVMDGRNLNEDDERSGAQVCVIGKTIADALFPGRSPVGGELRLHNISCRVVGQLETKGAAAFGQDQDDVIFLPAATFQRRIVGTERVAMMFASAVSTDRIDDAKEEITSIMRRQRHILPGEEDDFVVQDPREIQGVLQSVTGTLTLVLAGVAAIALVVGGIGVMNIMLVSVTERTREVGIRLAVGARARDILHQFLVEAIVLSSVGGAIGIGLGIAGTLAVSRAIGVPFVLPISAPVVAAGVSVLVGVVFGVWPARKASHLNPLAALRYE